MSPLLQSIEIGTNDTECLRAPVGVHNPSRDPEFDHRHAHLAPSLIVREGNQPWFPSEAQDLEQSVLRSPQELEGVGLGMGQW